MKTGSSEAFSNCFGKIFYNVCSKNIESSELFDIKSLAYTRIVYDSNCKVCTSLRDVVLQVTSIPESKVVAYGWLPPSQSNQVDAARFRNGMALIDTKGGETIYGSEGVAFIFSSQYRLVAFLLSSRLFLWLSTFLYRTLAYNRSSIAAP